jgi:hypothetical protein
VRRRFTAKRAALRASGELDRAAVVFATEQLLLHLSCDDSGDRARAAWLALRRAARAFVRVEDKSRRKKT